MAIIKRKIGVLILSGIFLASISFLFLVVTQKNFRVQADYLVVQDKDGDQDYYSISKSVEYMSKIFSQAIYSDLFIEEAVKTGKMSAEFLPFDKKRRLKEWSKIVKTDRNPEVGIISVTVYGDNKNDALRISEAIAEVFATKSYLFRGSGINMDVRKLSGPITDNNPTPEEILLVIVGGFIVGFMACLLWLLYFSNSFGLPKTKKINEDNEEIKEYLESIKYIES